MLCYKAWLETRWRFLIGLLLLMCSAAAAVFTYPKVVALLPMVDHVDLSGEIGRRIKEAADIQREYRGYIWYEWFGQNHTHLAVIFAVLLGTGGLLAQAPGGSALFTLSLPVSRARLLAVRAAIGLVELAALAVAPALLLPLLSPAVGQAYSLTDALVHSGCLFVVSGMFFSLAFLLSTAFNDIWRPLLIAFVVVAALAVADQVFRSLSSYGVFGLMSGEAYFRTARPPWAGLVASTAASAAMLYGSVLNIERQDF
jgi:ABC-2 type transport system permease protein